MRVRVLPAPGAAASAAAEIVVRAAARNPGLVIGLPTGRTMIPFYSVLAGRRRAGDLDLARARGFNVDELLLPAEHPASFHAFMARHAWEHIGLRQERCDIPDGSARPGAEALAECTRYDRAIAAAGGLDLVVLGLGADGHVAYNLPGERHRRTHVVQVPAAVADTLDVPAAHRPLGAITVGFGPLLAAGRIVLLATTAEKAAAVRALVAGPATPAWPCTLLREHPRFDVLLTPAAAGALRARQPAHAGELA